MGSTVHTCLLFGFGFGFGFDMGIGGARARDVSAGRTTTAWWPALWLTVFLAMPLLVTGCARFGFEAPHGGGRDSRGGAETGRADGLAADGEAGVIRDGTVEDRVHNTISPDGLTAPDRMGVDVSAVGDKKVSLDDKKAPLGLLCGTGKPAFTTYTNPGMVVCVDSGGVTYCDAAVLCPAGWTICDTTQYLARGGAVEQPKANAWIAGCVKKGSTVFPPDPNPCAPTCTSAPDPSPPNAIWTCTTNAGGSVTSYYLGIMSADTCYRIGSKQPTSAAFWIATAWDSMCNGAVCCAP